MPNDRDPDRGPSPGETMDLAYGLAHCLATVLAVFIRRDFGADALGWPAILGGLALYVTAVENRDRLARLFFLAWLVAQATQRFLTFRNHWRGVRVHSRSSGYPWLAMRLPFVRSEAVAVRLGEPLLCLAVGAALWPLSHPLGGFVMFGAGSFCLRNNIDALVRRKRLSAMLDARLEQEWYAEQMARLG